MRIVPKFFKEKIVMNEKYIFFQLLSAEESCVVSGGNSVEPYFSATSHTSGKLMNANSKGDSITFSNSSEDSTDENSPIDILAIALPSITPTTSKTTKSRSVVS